MTRFYSCRGDDSLQYRCGARAANDLFDFIAGRPVCCTSVGSDQYRRTVAVCLLDGVDIASWLVRNGHAFDCHSIRVTSTRLNRRKRNGLVAEFEPDRMMCHGSIEFVFGMVEGRSAVRMSRTRTHNVAWRFMRSCQVFVILQAVWPLNLLFDGLTDFQ